MNVGPFLPSWNAGLAKGNQGMCVIGKSCREEEAGFVTKKKKRGSNVFSTLPFTLSGSSDFLPRSSTDGKVTELLTQLQAIFGGLWGVCVCVRCTHRDSWPLPLFVSAVSKSEAPSTFVIIHYIN